MPIRSRVETLLVLESPSALCDDCLAPRVGATTRRYINRITSDLAISSNFVKSTGICKNCLKSTKLVTHFVASPADSSTQTPPPGPEEDSYYTNTREALETWFADGDKRDALVVLSRIVTRFMWYPPTKKGGNEKLSILLYRIMTWGALVILTRGKVELPRSRTIEFKSEAAKQNYAINRICDLFLTVLHLHSYDPRGIVDDIIDVSSKSGRLGQVPDGQLDVLDGLIRDIVKFRDANRLDVFRSQLYPANAPDKLMRRVTTANRIYRENNMDFIAEWYETFIRGGGHDVDMLQSIVEIPDEDWSRGAEHINKLIFEIRSGKRFKRLREATPLAERLVIDEDTGSLSIKPVLMLPANLYETGLDRLRDQITYMRSDQSNNFIQAMGPVLGKLEITLGKYANNPQRVHDDQISASKQIKKLINDGFLPDDHRIADFSDMLDLNALDIRAAIPEVAVAVQKRSDVRFQELDKDDRCKVQEAIKEVVKHSDKELADELKEDEEKTFQENRDQDNVESAYRLTSRLAKVEEILRNVGEIATVTGSIATIVATMVRDLSTVFEIAGLLLRLLGLA